MGHLRPAHPHPILIPFARLSLTSLIIGGDYAPARGPKVNASGWTEWGGVSERSASDTTNEWMEMKEAVVSLIPSSLRYASLGGDEERERRITSFTPWNRRLVSSPCVARSPTSVSMSFTRVARSSCHSLERRGYDEPREEGPIRAKSDGRREWATSDSGGSSSPRFTHLIITTDRSEVGMEEGAEWQRNERPLPSLPSSFRTVRSLSLIPLGDRTVPLSLCSSGS